MRRYKPAGQAHSRRKSRSDPHLVFAHAARQVVRHAHVQRPFGRFATM